jgi:hypothetical protein
MRFTALLAVISATSLLLAQPSAYGASEVDAHFNGVLVTRSHALYLSAQVTLGEAATFSTRVRRGGRVLRHRVRKVKAGRRIMEFKLPRSLSAGDRVKVIVRLTDHAGNHRTFRKSATIPEK